MEAPRTKTARNFFSVNSGTHWSIAGAVIVIMVGSYVIYSNTDRSPIPIVAVQAVTAPVALTPPPAIPPK
jgi:hypothetical protein